MNSCKKFIFAMLFIFAFSIVPAGCGFDNKDEDKKNAAAKAIILRLADVHPPDYPTVLGDKKFAEIVAQKTNGRIKIEVYPSGQLGEEKTVIEQVQLGAIDLARVSAVPLAAFSKPLGIFSLPYIFDNEDHLWRFLRSPDGKAVLSKLDSAKMHGLSYYAAGTRSFYSSKPLKSLADLKGKKIRVQQSIIGIDLVSALGGKAVEMPYGEVLSALRAGYVDAAENNIASFLSANHYQAAKNFLNNRHLMAPEVLLISKVAWNKLSADDKKILEDSAWESAGYQMEIWKKYEQEAKDKILAAGCVFTEVTDLRPWQNAVRPMLNKYQKEYKAQLDAIAKYRQK